MSGFVENVEFWHWWIAAALLLVLEIFAPGAIFLWLGISAVVVGFLLWGIPSMSWEIQIVIFAILSVVNVLAWRMYLRKNPIKTDQPVLNRRGHQYVGRVFTLTEPIVNGVGKIKVDDTTWKVSGMDREPEPSLFEEALPIFIDCYRQNACKQSRLYDGVREGLDHLTNNDYKLGCVTNKLSQFTDIILETLELQDKFGIVISGDTLAKKKPDPLPLLHAAEYFGVSPNRSLMVGDSVNDVRAARAAGFQVLCVSYGYNLGQDIRLANPDHVVDSLAELEAAF